MDPTVDQHRKAAPETVRCAVITVSDTRTVETDEGGRTVASLLAAAGHEVASQEIVPDQPDCMRGRIKSLQGMTDVILMTGGTGVGRRDQTYETVTGLLTKLLPGYGELFRALSYRQIGAAAMLSRATGGLVGRTVLLTMPGSPAGVRLAMENIILPELGHLVGEARK